MNSKVVLAIFIFVINFSEIIGQMTCNYNNTVYGYTCHLFINNPNGLNNFGVIGGTHLPGYTDSSVAKITIMPGSISPNFPSYICLKFKNIKEMTIRSLGLTRIDDYAFIGCTGLLDLELFNDPINTIHEKAFIRNLDLQRLWLYGNNITTLPVNVFQYQQRLDYLFIMFNDIKDLPENIFRPLVNLKALDLSSNNLKFLRPEWFETLSNLSDLFIPGNYISDFPKNIFSPLKSLYGFIAFGNKLKMIHADSFGFLPNLTYFSVDTNFIEAIDENLIDYTGITTIIMIGNTCATESIEDDSANRDYMRAMLRECFNNYERLTSGEFIKMVQC